MKRLPRCLLLIIFFCSNELRSEDETTSVSAKQETCLSAQYRWHSGAEAKILERRSDDFFLNADLVEESIIDQQYCRKRLACFSGLEEFERLTRMMDCTYGLMKERLRGF